jgi:hypothetical protein
MRRHRLRTALAACYVAAAVATAALADAAPSGPGASQSLLLESPDWPVGEVGAPPEMGAETATPPLNRIPAPPPLPPPPIDEQSTVQRGVRPYGGGHPADWSWGCGGSPYRTGPGLYDDWKAGCRWRVAVDGIVLTREDAELAALTAAIDQDSAGNPLVDPLLEQFDHGPGGRVAFLSQVPQHVGYQIHAAYEGVEEWNAAVVFPKFSPMPGSADPDSNEQRSLHYRSSFHSAELNFVREWHPMLQPFCGVRYIKFDDETNDFINQEAPPGIETSDRLNLFDLENNLIGFQIGSGFQLWHFGERLAIEGFFNEGVYYNKIKYTNLMGVSTTLADGTDSSVMNNDVSELSEISYVAESSISAVCRLNKCWALRAGYAALWIGNLHLAEDAFLDTGDDDENLLFHGWHAGVECRR